MEAQIKINELEYAKRVELDSRGRKRLKLDERLAGQEVKVYVDADPNNIERKEDEKEK